MRDPKTRYERGLDVCTTLSGSAEAAQGMADRVAAELEMLDQRESSTSTSGE